MSPALASGPQIALVLAPLALVHVPLGDYLPRMYTSSKNTRVERGFYRLLRIDARADQRWSTYLVSVLAFSVVSILLLWGLLSINRAVPFAFGAPNMPASHGFNTAVSFVTNTNWQSYAGESALGYTVQTIGLTVQTRVAVLNGGPHALSEIIYAFGSASNNNGSAFAGLGADSGFYDIALGFCMLRGTTCADRVRAGIGRVAGSADRRRFRPTW